MGVNYESTRISPGKEKIIQKRKSWGGKTHKTTAYADGGINSPVWGRRGGTGNTPMISGQREVKKKIGLVYLNRGVYIYMRQTTNGRPSNTVRLLISLCVDG